VIVVERLTKTFGTRPVLRGVDLQQARGETVVFIGPSGCGKSTFLRCLNQLETPDGGRITIGGVTMEGGQAVTREQQRQLRLRAGMVFQQFHLFLHQTALENVMEGPLHVLRWPRVEAEAFARELLAKVGLAEHANHLPGQLSGGQQQRVAIARALAMKPEVLLLDEPTSALDPELRDEVRVVLNQLADEGLTMLLVTHDMQLARQIADRVVFLDGGVIAEQGSPEQLFSAPQQARTREFLQKVRSE
jgi:ABC-type polar amino acid transport system ATPase subunit